MAVLQANTVQFIRHNLHTDVFYGQANTEVHFERCLEGRPVYSYVTSFCQNTQHPNHNSKFDLHDCVTPALNFVKVMLIFSYFTLFLTPHHI
jgi:hypothetical protein